MKTCLLLAWFWLSLTPAYALDMTQPASVRVTVQDAAGHPLPQAVVVIGKGKISRNAAGQYKFAARAPQPAPDIFWTAPLVVTLPGFLTQESDIRLFPGARIDLPITLYPPRTTRLHLRGPAGEAVSGVSVQINYETIDSAYHLPVSGNTNTQGDYVFTHPPLKSGFTLSVGSHSRNSDSQDYPDAPAVMVTLKPGELPPGFPPHPMQLTLLTSDGKPAADWQVAPQVNFTGSSGAFSSIIFLSEFTNDYAASGLIRTDKNGRALIPQAEDHLVLFSPSGIPLLYPLHPQTWPKGLHRVTLSLPPVRRTQTGRLTYPNGTPAANFPIRVSRAVTGIETWQVQTDEPTGTILTDANGHYALPQYFGTHYEYEAMRQPWAAFDLTTDHAILETYPGMEPKLPSDYKQITLNFVDEQGKLLPEIAVCSDELYQGAAHVMSSGGNGVTDTRGVHLFLPKTINRAAITTQAHDWKPLTKTLTLPGMGDMAFTITVPQSLHLKPLTGILLDPAGQPIPGATMPLYRGIDPHSGNTNNDYLQFSTTTDAQGRFTFDAAPDSCEIDLYRFGPDDQPNLPGWTDPPRVTPQMRDIVIRLKPFLTSTVRVLLPPSVTTAPKEVYLQSAPAKDELPDYMLPMFDPKAHTLLWNRILPGHYHLVTDDPTILPVTARIDQTVTLTEGKETEIDLRDQASAFPQPPTPITIPISVAVSGATVTLWTDQTPNERKLPADLTDDNGMVWLPLGVGQNGVVVAHVAGRMIGAAELTGTGEGESFSFGMAPAQTLTVPLKPLPLVNGKPPYDTRQVSLRPAAMKPDEAQAIFLVLGLLNADTGCLGDGPIPSAPLQKDPDGTWVAPDLPPGTYHVQTEADVHLP
jgi:hypothetical protein